MNLPLKVTYAAPNRANHIDFAKALHSRQMLEAFVCGLPRFSPFAQVPELGKRLVRADHLQMVYIALLRCRAPGIVSEEMAYLSKIWIDRRSYRYAKKSDYFIFYSGCGLTTARRLKGRGVRLIVEAVNSHVLEQQSILRREHEMLNIPFRGFHPREVARRTMEVEMADGILCPSDFVAESFLKRGFSREQIMVVPYGFTSYGSAEAVVAAPGAFRILYVGQISVRKGLRYLIEAFKKLDHPGKELVIVGARTEITGLDDLFIPENVRFEGVLRGLELAKAYQSADVFVQPSIEEGLSLVMAEALSYGLPVIATHNSGASNLFVDGREGYIVEVRDPESIRARLQTLADDPGLLRRMGARAKVAADKIGGWKESTSEFIEKLKTFGQRTR